MTFDLDFWPTDLNIKWGHILIKDYLRTKFEASGTKRSWVISCTRWSNWHDLWPWPLTYWPELIGVIHSSRTIYVPSLKLLGQSILELSVTQDEVDWHDLWPWPLTHWPEYQKESSTHQGLSLSTYQVWNFWGKAFLSYPLHKVWETDMTFDLDLWPTDLNINRDHLLIKDYLPTKFEASGAKRSWVISCTRLRDTVIPTYRPTDIPTAMCKPICLSFFDGGHNESNITHVPEVSVSLVGKNVLDPRILRTAEFCPSKKGHWHSPLKYIKHIQ